MEEERFNWLQYARLIILVGNKVLQKNLGFRIQTRCLGMYLRYWYDGKQNAFSVNHIAILWAKFNQHWGNQTKQPVHKKLLSSWQRQHSLKSLSEQILVLEKWHADIKSNPPNEQSMLLSWLSAIQNEAKDLNLLLEITNKWIMEFEALVNEAQINLHKCIAENHDRLLEHIKSRLRTLCSKPYKNLQEFASTSQQDVKNVSVTWAKQLKEFHSTWKQKVEEKLNSYQSTQQDSAPLQMLHSLVTEFKTELSILHLECHNQLSSICSNWHMELQSILVNWNQKVDNFTGSLDESQSLINALQEDLNKFPSSEEQQLQEFFHLKETTDALEKLKSTKALSEKQLEMLNPSEGYPNILKYDNTILTILLKSVVPVCPPDYGWCTTKHTEKDISFGADLMRLHSLRNEYFGHTPQMVLPKERFSCLWEETESLLSRLASYCGQETLTEILEQMHKIKTSSIETSEKDYLLILKLELESLKQQFKEETITAIQATFREQLKDFLLQLEPIKQALESAETITAIQATFREQLKDFLLQLEPIKQALESAGMVQGKDDKMEEKMRKLKKMLIEYYKTLDSVQVRHLPEVEDLSPDVEDLSLGDIYTEPIIEIERKESSCTWVEGRSGDATEVMCVSSFEHIFKENNKRIVLKAPLGMGKSIFCRMLLQVWCDLQRKKLTPDESRTSLTSGLIDEHMLLQFEIPIFIDLCQLSSGNDLLEVIYKQVPILKEETSDLSTDELISLMTEDRKVLLIMDGLNEMNVEAPFIEQILRRALFPTMVVFVASRPLMIDTLQLRHHTHIDLMLNLKGFSKQNSFSFVQKILEKCYNNGSALQQFKDTSEKCIIMSSIIDVPFLLCILVHELQEKKSVPVFELFLKIFDITVNFIQKSRLEKLVIERDTHDFLSLDADNFRLVSKIQNLHFIQKFGRGPFMLLCKLARDFSFSSQRENSFICKTREFLDRYDTDWEQMSQIALKTGFFSQPKISAFDEQKVRMSFPHKIFKEWFTAFDIFCNNKSLEQFLALLKTEDNVHKMKNIVIFLAGLSAKHCEEVFDEIYKNVENSHEHKKEDPYENVKPNFLFELFLNCVEEASPGHIRLKLKGVYANSEADFDKLRTSLKNTSDVNILHLSNINFASETCCTKLDISQYQNLSCLSLYNVKLCSTNLEFSIVPYLSHLSLAYITNSDENSKIMLQSAHLRSLELWYINLSNVQLDLTNALCLTEVIFFNVKMSSMTNIKISKCTHLQKAVLRSSMLDDIEFDMSEASCLTMLVIECVTMPTERTRINLSKCVQLKEINLKSCKIDDVTLDLSGASSMSCLKLQGVTMLSKCTIRASQCVQLNRLQLVETVLDNITLDFRNAPCLSELEIRKITVTKRSKIMVSKCGALKTVYLANINLDEIQVDLSETSSLSEVIFSDLEMCNESKVALYNYISNSSEMTNMSLKNLNMGSALFSLGKFHKLREVELANITVSHSCFDQITSSFQYIPIMGRLEPIAVYGVHESYLINLHVTSQYNSSTYG